MPPVGSVRDILDLKQLAGVEAGNVISVRFRTDAPTILALSSFTSLVALVGSAVTVDAQGREQLAIASVTGDWHLVKPMDLVATTAFHSHRHSLEAALRYIAAGLNVISPGRASL